MSKQRKNGKPHGRENSGLSWRPTSWWSLYFGHSETLNHFWMRSSRHSATHSRRCRWGGWREYFLKNLNMKKFLVILWFILGFSHSVFWARAINILYVKQCSFPYLSSCDPIEYIRLASVIGTYLMVLWFVWIFISVILSLSKKQRIINHFIKACFITIGIGLLAVLINIYVSQS